MTPTDELQRTIDLLKIEQDEDRNQYREKILGASIQERKKAGTTWYPIVIRESYYGTGERLILEIERPGDLSIPNLFQFGSVASLFSNYHNEGKENPSISGVVSLVRRNNIRLTLFVDELPEWVDTGKLGIDLMFDESSYKEMNSALQQVMKAKNNRLAQLREILLGAEEAKFAEEEILKFQGLNEMQTKSIQKIAAAEDVAIIHGPPGTGKTTTIVQAIAHTLKIEAQVLVCAPSNNAVDLLTLKLHAAGLKVVRLGNPARINEELQALSLDSAISSHKDFKQIKEFKKMAAEYKNMASKYKRHFGHAEREQRRAILDESRKLQAEAEKIESFIVSDLIEKAQVITCTLVGSANYTIRDRSYSTVFIDEAGQAPEPACWIPILRAERVVLAGDHQQLPPTIKSRQAASEGLAVTLFEKTIQRQKADTMLEVQYRMNEKIMEFSNKEFYKDKLKAHESVKDQTIGDSPAVEFIDTAGCSFNEEQGQGRESLVNTGEADVLFKHLDELLAQNILDEKNSIGIISPYKAQVNLLETKLEEHKELKQLGKRLAVNTVDGFQGQERDLIYISLVRSNENGEIGFLNDLRRMNVAMTRARKKLVILGDSATLARHPFYRDMLNYMESIGAYRSAWELLY
ncbi:MAG TPA: AAA domain-containing protein [Cytophagaceae bacterium]|nr:AAA domain-containing protein [Cytophagaceae bacterium]